MLGLCRWCLDLVTVTDSGIVGLDGETTCDNNTAGCGVDCGFSCNCSGDGWTYGGHEQMELEVAA